MMTSIDVPVWDSLQASDLAVEVKTDLNRTVLALDEMATATLKCVCAVRDGDPLPSDAVDRAAELVAAIRRLPLLV